MLFNNKDKVTKNFHFQFLVIKSGSMLPELNINDIVIIKKYNDYEVGDIITYNYQDKYLITHRIIEKSDSEFMTKGDNNNSEDLENVQIQNVKGKVILIIKNQYLKNVIIVLLIIILINIFRKGICNEKHN